MKKINKWDVEALGFQIRVIDDEVFEKRHGFKDFVGILPYKQATKYLKKTTISIMKIKENSFFKK